MEAKWIERGEEKGASVAEDEAVDEGIDARYRSSEKDIDVRGERTLGTTHVGCPDLDQ